MPAHERRGLILKEAAVFFAENGFSASTRDLADRLGVRQALLYKYFESKEALIETVFQQAFDEKYPPSSLNGASAALLRERTLAQQQLKEDMAAALPPARAEDGV